jgi:outer membrane receptor protein involved in Fe transport
VTPGRTYGGETEDWGVSGQVDWNFGAAALTSITAYRNYKSDQGGDIDYGTVDLLFREDDGTAFRRFKTFTQEFRLQGSLFDERVDWLVGAYYANEKLRTQDNLQFGADYGQFLACRLVSAISASPALRDPDRDGDGCLSAVGMGTLLGAFRGANAAGGTDGSQLISALQRLGNVANVGFNSGGGFNQKSENYAFFTHNIFKITDALSVTLGARYTNETKNLRANFNNNNAFCPAQQGATLPAIAGSGNPTARSLLGGAIQFACLFNSSERLNALNLEDQRKEDEFTGTAVLSWKPTRDLLTYASYSRGYKAGGFNLDASALGSPITPRSNADVVNLQFDAEKVNAYEVGFKYGSRRFNLNAAAFRQEFDSFQLNTFNGLFFLVQNVNGCSDLIGGSGADEDGSSDTGTCSPDNIQPGVISQGVEVEAALFPTRNLAITAGFTYASTKYEDDLVGRDTGTPALANELFQLPGNNLSNAPQIVVTSSLAWTPDIGSSGLSGLFYVDTRLTGDYNTGSDLFPEKEQDGYVLVNARVGLRGPDQRWAVELWAQNLFDINYDQVAFNSPLQASGTGSRAHVQELGSAFSAQLFSAFLAEPRTYGITLRGRF